jgi:hypothetical protein
MTEGLNPSKTVPSCAARAKSLIFIAMQICFFSRHRVESLDFPRIFAREVQISTKLSTD